MNLFVGGCFISHIETWLGAWGYRYIEVPSLVSTEMFKSCTDGTENRMFEITPGISLMPEVTNYIRSLGSQRIGSQKIYYVARCFRDESSTDSERLREFTQIGVEFLGQNSLDCLKQVRRDAINLFVEFFGKDSTKWELVDGAVRGLNLYDNSGKAFEITTTSTRKQLLGGGPYIGGAGWALGIERFMIALGI